MRRVAVIGCGGAGKTTLANELGRRLSLPVMHVDGYCWQRRRDGTDVESTPEAWHRVHEAMIADERWVIDGMELGVLPARLEAADTVVFLDLPAWRCLWGVLKRRLRYRGQMRPDIGVYDRINAKFVRWICSFRSSARPRILALLRECPCHVVVLHSHREVRAFLRSLPRLERGVAERQQGPCDNCEQNHRCDSVDGRGGGSLDGERHRQHGDHDQDRPKRVQEVSQHVVAGYVANPPLPRSSRPLEAEAGWSGPRLR